MRVTIALAALVAAATAAPIAAAGGKLLFLFISRQWQDTEDS